MRRCAWLVVMLAASPACSTSRHPDDAGTDDAPVADLDPVGTWLTCHLEWTFSEEGALELRDHRAACTASGTWSSAGPRLLITWSTEGCGADPLVPWVGAGIRNDAHLTIQRDGDSGPTTLLDDDVFGIEMYTMIGDVDPSRRSVVSLARAPGRDAIDGCYWSEDRACGGLLSCTGRVLQWLPTDEGVTASTGCQGDCPCGAVLRLVPEGPGYAVAYRGVNCEGTFEGTASATPRPAP